MQQRLLAQFNIFVFFFKFKKFQAMNLFYKNVVQNNFFFSKVHLSFRNQ